MDWESAENEVLINPRMPLEDKERFVRGLQHLESFQNHVWMATSGSSGVMKWVALSKHALLTSARAVNAHLQVSSKDVWLNPLPHFHVGGLGIEARSFVSGTRSVQYHSKSESKWDPLSFVQQLQEHKVTLTSLVPTQVFDLVSRRLGAPKDLRAIVVGGGALNEGVYRRAIELGWKLLPSYGMTECCSQVATAALSSLDHADFPKLDQLTHVELRINPSGFLEINSASLLTAYAYFDSTGLKVVDPKKERWFTTEDQVKLSHGQIEHISRGENFIKIGGESVDLARLQKILEDQLLTHDRVIDGFLVPKQDERLGHVIAFVCAPLSEVVTATKIVEEFNQLVMPFERIRFVKYVEGIPRSPLGKVDGVFIKSVKSFIM